MKSAKQLQQDIKEAQKELEQLQSECPHKDKELQQMEDGSVLNVCKRCKTTSVPNQEDVKRFLSS
jgi:cell division protein FtsB